MTADAGTHVAPAHGALPGPSDGLLAELEGAYKDIHAHPELSMQERRTAGIAAAWLRQQGYEATEGSAAPAWSGCCATGTGRRCCCAPTWTPCRSRRAPACPMPATHPARTASARPPRSRTPAAMTCTWPG